MKILVLTISAILVCVCPLGAEAQNKVQVHRGKVSKTKENRPTVFLTFDQKIKSSALSDSDHLAFLFHNNTNWGIRLDVAGAETAFGKNRLFYDLLTGPDQVSERFECHVCTTMILRPHQDFRFSVRDVELSRLYAMRVRFNYDWEQRDNISRGLEPSHFVFFYFEGIPKDKS
ncbi:MAG: hypothetical protein ABI878_12200 [Acidobacteriota bacterium]